MLSMNSIRAADKELNTNRADKVETLEHCQVIYSTTPKGKPAAIMYVGKSLKPVFNYSFKSEEHRADYVTEQVRRVNGWKNNILDRKQAKKEFKHTLKAGDVLVCSWGYDQTNKDFYQVIEVKDKSVIIREISNHLIEGEESFMAGRVMPEINHFIGDPMIKRVKEGNRVKIKSYANASPWDGEPEHISWYA